MRTALTSTEKSTWRSHPQRAEYYIAVAKPRVVWSGSVLAIPDTFPASAVVANGTISGNLADVSKGMTLRIGTNSGEYDRGKMRIRSAPTGASIIHTGEFGSGIARWNSAILSVVEEYAPWSIHPAYDTAASQWLVDLDAYTAQHSQYGPLAVAGPPAVLWIEGGKGMASYVGDRSFSFTGGVSITSQSWGFPNGQAVTSALGSSQNPVVITYTNASSGGRYHTLTITDSNGASHIGQRLTFAFNASNAQPQRVWIEEIAGGINDGGYEGRVVTYGSATSDNFPEGAQVVIFERASYNGIASSLGGNYFGRENIVFTGWILNESVRIEPFTGEVSFRVGTINKVLEQADSYDLFLESGSAASAWDMASGLTIDRAALALVKYRSTIGNVTDFYPAGDSASGVELAFRSLPQGNLWEQLQYNYEAVLGTVAADLQSSVYASLDAQVTGASASLPLIADVAYGDRRDEITNERPHFDLNSQQVIYAIRGGVNTAIGGVSPSHRVGYYGKRQEISRNCTAADTDTVIVWAGNLRAKNNNPYKEVAIPLAGNLRLDPVPQGRITMSLSPTDSTNLRGINWNNQTLLPHSLRITYKPEALFPLITLSAEATVDGHGGSSVDFPPDIVPPSTPTPTPIAPPDGGGGQGDLVYFATASFIGRTRNFTHSSPSWVNVTGVVSGTIQDFILDPYDPKNIAWCVTSTGVYRTTTLNEISPVWTSITTGITASYRRIVSTIAASGYFAILAITTGVASSRIGVTANNGTSWSWTTVRLGDAMPSGLDRSDRNVTDIFGGSQNASSNAVVDISVNGGTSYSPSATASAGTTLDVLYPYGGNEDGQTLFIVTTGGVFKTSNLGTGWTTITPSGYTPTSVGNKFPGLIIGDTTTLYLTDADGTAAKLWKTTNGGTTWSIINSNLGAGAKTLGLWPYDSRQVYMTPANGGPRFSIDGGLTFQNKSGNWVSTIGSLTAAVQLVPVWVS